MMITNINKYKFGSTQTFFVKFTIRILYIVYEALLRQPINGISAPSNLSVLWYYRDQIYVDNIVRNMIVLGILF